MRVRVIRVAALAAVLLCAQSCATIMLNTGPNTLQVPVSSTPAGARILLDGQDTGQVTPAEVGVLENGDGQIRLELDGYEVANTSLDTTFNWWVTGNLLSAAGGLTAIVTFPAGLIIDTVSGSALRWTTEPVHVDLVPLEAAK